MGDPTYPPIDFGAFPDLPLVVELGMHQNAMHPQGRHNEEK